jgi:hypothetical protein
MKLLLALTISIFGVAFSHPKSYVDALRSYDGKPYLEETCSALICDAHDHVSTAKTRCTARELWNGCGGTLSEVAEAGSLGELDWSTVKAGDVLAMNGVHVIAYLGDGQCIDSDPLLGGVGEVSVDSLIGKKNDVWFSGPVRVKRWVR